MCGTVSGMPLCLFYKIDHTLSITFVCCFLTLCCEQEILVVLTTSLLMAADVATVI